MMGSITSWRPSPALVVSFVALFVALSGTAVALSKGEVRSKHIANNAVKTKHVKNGAINSPKIRDGAVTTAKLAEGVAIPGPKGDKGDPGPQGPPGLSTGPAGGDLIGDYPDPTIAAGAVDTGKLANGAVNAQKIAAGAVTAVRIADGAVVNRTLGSGAVRADNLGFATGTTGPNQTWAANAVTTHDQACPSERRLLAGGLVNANQFLLVTGSHPLNSVTWRVTARNLSSSPIAAPIRVLCLN